MLYALLDWDNTLRRGYTLFSWIDYLVSNDIINQGIQDSMDESIRKYKMGEITHDDLSRQAGEIYASYIKGYRENDIVDSLTAYRKSDESQLHSFTESLFELLFKNDIKPIIVSGSPRHIISGYFAQFHLYKVFALEAQVNDGYFTGNVQANYGYNKGNLARRICNEFGAKPVLAFGDAESDFPMLESARFGFLVGNKNQPVLARRKFKSFSADSDATAVIDLVASAINQL